MDSQFLPTDTQPHQDQFLTPCPSSLIPNSRKKSSFEKTSDPNDSTSTFDKLDSSEEDSNKNAESSLLSSSEPRTQSADEVNSPINLNEPAFEEIIPIGNMSPENPLISDNLEFPRDFMIARHRSYRELRIPEAKGYLLKMLAVTLFIVGLSCTLLLMLGFYISFPTAYVFFTLMCTAPVIIDMFYGTRLFGHDWFFMGPALIIPELFAGFFAVSLIYYYLVHLLPICSFAIIPYLISITFSVLFKTHPLTDKMPRIRSQIAFAAQTLLISLKYDGLITCDWEYVFTVSWIYFGRIFLLKFKKMLNQSAQTGEDESSLKKLKETGIIWSLWLYITFLVASFVFIRASKAYDSGISLGLWSVFVCAILCDAILLFGYTCYTHKTIVNFLTTFEVVDSLNVRLELVEELKAEKGVKFEVEKKRDYFVMVSSTYFVPATENDMKRNYDVEACLENCSEANKEENQCYICCRNVSDAVIAGCGHGGVCMSCAMMLAKTKAECMECRMKMKAIYKIDPQSKQANNIVKGIELHTIVNQ